VAYLAEKYAYLLQKEDVSQLFQELEKTHGSISKACRECGIVRKTKYDWNRTISLKLDTKKKVLKALMKINSEKILEYLLVRSKENTVDLLSINLSYLYEKAMAENIEERSFIQSIKRFEKIKNEHAGLIREIEEEIGDMSRFIREKALQLGVTLPPEPIDTFRPSHLLEMIPTVIDTIYYRQDFRNFAELAKDLHVPKELVETLFKSILLSGRGITARVQAGRPGLEPFPSPYDKILPGIGQVPPTASIQYPDIWEEKSHM